MTKEKEYSVEWLGRTLTIKTGKLAKQATAAVTVQYGETVVLATVVQNKGEREGVDYFPLMVDFEEKLYAAGIIKGSRWIKREGRPTDEAILTGRMIDRSIRPLFDGDTRKETQVILSVLSADGENDFDIVSMVAAAAVLSISGIDWKGPIAGIRVGMDMEGKFIFNPTYEERETSPLDLIVSSSKDKILMIEAGGDEIKEDKMFEAIMAGHKEQGPVVELLEKMKKELAPAETKELQKLISEDEIEAEKEKEKVFAMAQEWLDKNVESTLFNKEYYTKGERKMAVGAIKDGLDKHLFEQSISKDKRAQAIGKLVEKSVDTAITNGILKHKKRVDGRKITEIRELYSENSLLPRTHGSSLFNRGETQVMSIITLAGPGLAQTIDGIEGESEKRFMHHYNFPPFSVGEARFMRGPGRRDIGHGALAEKALRPMIPSKDDFPYTIRVVSETLGSNGSSSMASTCAASLSLMDAGVPVKAAVAGIAIGLSSNDDMSEWEVLTDIQDLEDGKGGMDFKVAGSANGITAIQLDTKTLGITEEIIKQALKQGLDARLEILKTMNKTIDAPRAELSKHAPRIISFKIDPEKIRDVIGPGGKIINKIIEETGVSIDIEDDGSVFICGTNPEKTQQAEDTVKDITRVFEAGEIFTGKVMRILDFGAFVELTPGNDGMVHVSQLAPYRIGSPSDFISEGDMVTVKIKEIDEKGRVNLTMLGQPENEKLWKDEKGKSEGMGRPSFSNNRGGSGGNRSGGNRGGRRF